MTKEQLMEKYAALESAMNSVAGCGMFDPEQLKSRDLPRLIEAMQEASVEFGMALEQYEDGVTP